MANIYSLRVAQFLIEIVAFGIFPNKSGDIYTQSFSISIDLCYRAFIAGDTVEDRRVFTKCTDCSSVLDIAFL